MNIVLLRKIQAKILADPEQYAEWDHAYWDEATAGIAGWAIILSIPGTTPAMMDDLIKDGWSVAMHLLGIFPDEAEALFNVKRWPEAYRVRYWRAETADARAQAASDLIDEFANDRGALKKR